MALKRTITFRGKYGSAPASSSGKRFKSTRSRTLSVRAPTYIPRRLGYNDQACGVPPLMRTTLTYSSGIAYFGRTLGAGTNASYLFRGNGLYDPDYQVGGQQPMGFDQWSTLYRHYRVIGSRCTVTLGQQTRTLIALNKMGVEATTYTFDAQNSTALPGCKYSMCENNQNTGGNIKLISYGNSSAMTGFNRNEDLLSAQVTADPGAMWYWIVTACNADSSGEYFSMNVKIDYFVEFFHPQVQNMS